jgi:hypothetical protein
MKMPCETAADLFHRFAAKLCYDGFWHQVLVAGEALQSAGDDSLDLSAGSNAENLEEFYSGLYSTLPYFHAAGRLWKILTQCGSRTDRIEMLAGSIERKANVTEEKSVRILGSLLSFAWDDAGQVFGERVGNVARALYQRGTYAAVQKVSEYVDLHFFYPRKYKEILLQKAQA